LAAPKAKEFLQVAGALCYLRRNRAVNIYSCSLDVLEDSLIGSWFATRIVLRLQAIDRYYDIQFLQFHPRGRDHPECARDDLCMYGAGLDLWQKRFELTVPYQRIATYQRDMERFVLIDERKHSGYQVIALEVGELA
jgi:hypothetical protein